MLNKKLNFAAIDIGSNAVRFLIKSVPEGEPPSAMTKTVLIRIPLRLGEDSFRRGVITTFKEKQLMRTVKAFRLLMKVYGVTAYRACATSAMRDASNGERIARKIHNKTGIRLEIIDGQQEARIVYDSHVADLLDREGTYLYVDVGGGSTEISLIADGKLKYPSGKQEMIYEGVFDDIDIMLSCHAMGLDMEKYHAEIGASLNGFIQKRAIFKGKAAHAGANPEGGVNALNAANLAMTAINFQRETFRAEDAIRVHFVMQEGGQTVNTIPSRTQMEMYVRAKTVDAIFETEEKVNRSLKAGAMAIGCDLEIQDTPGYFPLHQDENLTELLKKHIRNYMDDSMIAQGTHGFASGDMGDISMMWPTVEIGTAGFSGTIHGKDFKTADPVQAFDIPARYFADAIEELLSDGGAAAWRIKEAFRPVMSKTDYLEKLDSLNKSTNFIYSKGE